MTAPQPDLFGGDEARQRLAIERKAALREEPAYRAGMTRRGDHKTSRGAAKTVARRQGTIRQAVAVYVEGRGALGATDAEITAHLGHGKPESSYRKRRTELAFDGVLLDSGRTRANRHGRDVVVWVHKNHAGPGAKLVHRPEAKVSSDVKALCDALRPFAVFGDARRQWPATMVITTGSGLAKQQLTMGDCYAAADALARFEGEKE